MIGEHSGKIPNQEFQSALKGDGIPREWAHAKVPPPEEAQGMESERSIAAEEETLP